jgi:hypothetical protein
LLERAKNQRQNRNLFQGSRHALTWLLLTFTKSLMHESAVNKFGWAPNMREKSDLCGFEKTLADERNYTIFQSGQLKFEFKGHAPMARTAGDTQ